MEYTDKLFDFDNTFSGGQMQIPLGELYQVAELSLIRDGVIGQHTQTCDEVTYIVSGSCKIFSDDTCYEMKAGEVHYTQKGCEHRILASADENLRYICFAFFPEKDHPTVQAFYQALEGRKHFAVRDNGTVKVLSEYLVRELYHRDEESLEMIHSFITQILITLARILKGKDLEYNGTGDKKSSYYAMYKLLRYLDNEFLRIKNVRSVAEALSYSEYYLSHLFSEKMGMSIKEYLLRKKVAYASEALKNNKMTIEEIAEQLNFSSASSFRRAFKQIVGLSPNDFKKMQHRKK